MISKKCDRCGKYFDMPDEYSDKLNPIGIILVNWFGRDMPSTRIDLCKDCMDELQEWIRPQRTIYTRFPLAECILSGSVVMTKDALDIGWVAETQLGKPTEIYGQIDLSNSSKFPHYSVDAVEWYNTNIIITLEEWRELSLAYQHDALGWHNYWRRRLGLPRSWGNL